MREILFRGKTDKGTWIYGDIDTITLSNKNRCTITDCDTGESFPVDRKTVGQYIGIKDREGTQIFKGDIISRKITKTDTMFKKTTETIITKVVFHNVNFKLELLIRNKNRLNISSDGFYGWSYFDNIQEEVIGNIHDNPELLEQEQSK